MEVDVARSGTSTGATADASSKTRTARVGHIKLQLRLLFKRTVTVSAATLQRIALGVEKKIIHEIEFTGDDKEGLCHASLSFEVDWDEHNKQLELGNTHIEIDGDE